MLKRFVLPLSILLLVAACGGESEGADATQATSTTAGPDSTTSTSPQPSVQPSVAPETTVGVFTDEATVQAALQQATEDTGLSQEQLSVELAMQVTWNDGSLGCPQEGQAYIQSLVDGYWVVFTDGDEKYDYRSGMDQNFKRCIDGAPPVDSYVDR